MNTLLDRMWSSRWKHALLPLSFLFGSLLNLGFYYVGLAYTDNPARTYGFIIGQLLFAVLCGLVFLAAMRHERLHRSAWTGLGLFLLFYCINFVAGFVRHGMNDYWTDYFVHFICFAVPALLAGIFAALSHSEKKFLPLMEKISFFVLPAGVIYFNGLLFNCNPFGYNCYLGIINYMNFAYTLMPFLLVHIIQFCDCAPLELPLCKRGIAHRQLLRGTLIAVYWIDLIGSGTRGTYVCVAGFCVLLILSKLLHKDGALRAFALSAVMAAVLLFNMFVYAPAGMYAVSRMNIFLDGLKQGEIVTAIDAKDTQDKLDSLVSMDGDQQVANREDSSESAPGDAAENVTIINRGTLYKLACKEFLKSPLIGMGVSGYSIKYVEQPHNAILDLFCEGGILLGGPILLLILWALIRMVLLARYDRSIRYLLLIFLAYGIRANISGSVWTCAYLLCAVGFGFALTSAPVVCGSEESPDSPLSRRKRK